MVKLVLGDVLVLCFVCAPRRGVRWEVGWVEGRAPA